MRGNRTVWYAGAAVAIAIGVGIFFAARDERNGPAIQAVTAYVLVLVTTIYVVFTHGLMQAQRRHARDRIETEAVAELARTLHQAKRFLVPALEHEFPLAGRGAKPNFDRLAAPDKTLLDLYWDLNRIAPDLPPAIRDRADDTWRTVWMASSDTVNILWAFRCEERAASSGGRTWSWEGAARVYRDEHEVGRKRDPGAWYDMIRGERVVEAIAALNGLAAEVEKLRR